MSDTLKTPKGSRMPDVKPRSVREGWLIWARHTYYDSTEKILRRNRRLWARKVAKAGRQVDKAEIAASRGAGDDR